MKTRNSLEHIFVSESCVYLELDYIFTKVVASDRVIVILVASGQERDKIGWWLLLAQHR